MTSPHISVLLGECVEAFKECASGTIVDCTTGFAGHSEKILQTYDNQKMACIDRDQDALDFATKRLEPFKERVQFIKSSFGDGILQVEDKNIVGVLADLGVSSYQLDEEERGFSFNSDNLDMRMDRSQDLSANEIVNNYSQHELEKIIKEYGEDSYYKKIASLIVNNRPFTSGKELADLMEKNFKRGKTHPATKLFQGIRIEVNGELNQVKELFSNIEKIAQKGTTVAIISFHSLEDRIVKQTFKEWSKSCICPPNVFRCQCGNNHGKGKILTKKPIIPTDKEIKENPRSRSSKLRIFRFE
ncbi:MAG: 16S rRNA (cytosine(1402)-N(4))-methyltransferase RsmH [Campylobacterales bacterium]|nr:16S rRNA (cytosine(1402)-N(4))-methyltransferase RsmH [Campylobacterales bacterium]